MTLASPSTLIGNVAATALLTVGQLHHALNQLQQLQIGIQPGRRGAGLQLQDVTQFDRRGVDRRRPATRPSAVIDFGGRAVELHHCRGGLNQLRDRGLSVEQLRVVAGGDIEVDRQLIEVFEQVDVGVEQAVPAQRGEIDVATQQPGKQRIEDVRLARYRCVASVLRMFSWAMVGCGFAATADSVERGVEADRAAGEQRLHAAGKTGGAPMRLATTLTAAACVASTVNVRMPVAAVSKVPQVVARVLLASTV